MKIMKKMTAGIVFLLVFSLILCACDSAANINIDNGDGDTKNDAATQQPTEKNTEAPTQNPTEGPTQNPTEGPTQKPTEAPTQKPTTPPTEKPTEMPTEHSHEYGDWVVRQEASCTENGIKIQECACGDSKSEVIPATGHTLGADATCTTAQICTVCGTELTPMLGHIPANAVEENRVEPTCTGQGSYDTVIYCSVCNVEISRENANIPATGHTLGADATCTTAQICTVCGAELTPAIGHTPGADATCTEAQICIVCETELTPALGHTPGADATCATAQICIVCEAELTPALGHNYSVTAVTPPTCTEKGYTKYMCTICNDEHIADETNALGHTPGPEATSTTAQVCTTCGAELVPALGEDPTEQPGEEPTDKPTEPESKPKKYFTLSFDDGITQDLKIIEILKKYNVDCCSFNINTGLYGANWTWVGEALHVPTLTHIRFTEEELRTGIYDGFDVLVHTKTHPSLKNCSLKQLKDEIIGDADNIESITGVRPVGMAWPGGDTEFNLTNIRNILRYTDIRFARCTTPTYTFDLPEKFMTWYPTCSFSDARLFELAQQFIDAEPTEDMLFYVWGHGYEMDIPGVNSYEEFEQLIKMISEADDIVLVTNTEFYELYKDQIESY